MRRREEEAIREEEEVTNSDTKMQKWKIHQGS